MINELRELARYRDLLKQLVVRDLKVRYKNSVLGFFWSLLNPLVRVATITVMVRYMMQLNIPSYSAYLLAAYLPWVFFQMALLDSSQVVIHHRDLLRKVYFPREVLPLSTVASNLVHFLLALVVFFAYVIVYLHLILHGRGLLLTTLWLPALVGMQCLLIVGITHIVSCLNVFFEDTKYVLSVLLDVFFYLSPVMYPIELVRSWLAGTNLPEAYQSLLYNLYLLNPMNIITDAYRKLLLPPTELNLRGMEIKSLPLDYQMLGIAAVTCALVAIAGYSFFNARKWAFAERV